MALTYGLLHLHFAVYCRLRKKLKKLSNCNANLLRDFNNKRFSEGKNKDLRSIEYSNSAIWSHDLERAGYARLFFNYKK